MTLWTDVLDELQRGVAEAPENDIWYHLTAAGLTQQSLADAADAANFVADHVPDLATCRVADLGCGVGRHLAVLVDRCAEVVGVESSPDLARLARRFVPGAKIVAMSFQDLAECGSFDVVCAFSHSLMLTASIEGVLCNLQLVRGAMPDYGLLVVEVMPIELGVSEWSAPCGVAIREERRPTPTGHRHQFEVSSPRGTWSAELSSAAVDPAQWPVLAEEGGFRLEAIEPFVCSDGTSSCFYFLRAQKGFNFLSDLTELLESWSDSNHPRNLRAVHWAEGDVSGRVRPAGSIALGQGASLSKHHPDFARALEERIKPLVLELAIHWNYVTYSSCGGHLVEDGPSEVFSEAYCGIVALSTKQGATVVRLVDWASEGLALVDISVDVRVRPLHGTGTTLTAADIMFRRRSTDTAWAAYVAELERVVAAMCERLGGVRERT